MSLGRFKRTPPDPIRLRDDPKPEYLRLTDQQKLYLLLIDERTEMNWETGELRSYWMPPDGNKTSTIKCLGGHIFVDGSGVARTLKSLETRSLTKKQRFNYSYSITERGHKIAEYLKADADEIERLSKQVFK